MGIVHYGLVEDVSVGVRGDGLVIARPAVGADIVGIARGGVGGGNGGGAVHLIAVLVGCFRRNLLRRGGRLPIGNELVGDGAVILTGIHADQARAAAAHQPAIVRNGGHLGIRVLGDLRAHIGVVHQAGKAKRPAGAADDAAALHIAAGAYVGTDTGEEQIVGIIRIIGHLDDDSAAPLGVHAAGNVQGAAGGGVYRLTGARIHDQLLAAIGQGAVALVRAAGVGAAVEGVLIFPPAAG